MVGSFNRHIEILRSVGVLFNHVDVHVLKNTLAFDRKSVRYLRSLSLMQEPVRKSELQQFL